MKITIRHHLLRSRHDLDAIVEERLLTLAQTNPLEEARVALEYRAGASPAFRAEISVSVPGPDLRAEAVDHTVHGAAQRALAELEGKLRERTLRRERRKSRHRKNPAGFRIGRRSR
jgi:ribosome-associated translation inhibitor RaiA